MSDHDLTEDEIIERHKLTEYIEDRMRPIPEERTCVWTRDDDEQYGHDSWDGTCGVAWSLNDGTPAENGMNYCPRCGARLETQQPKEPQ